MFIQKKKSFQQDENANNRYHYGKSHKLKLNNAPSNNSKKDFSIFMNSFKNI